MEIGRGLGAEPQEIFENHALYFDSKVGTRATFDFYMFVIVLLRGRKTVTQNSRRSAEYPNKKLLFYWFVKTNDNKIGSNHSPDDCFI